MRDYIRRSRENSDSQSSNIRLHAPSQESQGSQRNNYQNHPDIRVQRFYAGLPPLQTKLQIGKSGDKYEQEADRIADKVVSGSDARTPLGNKISPIVQQSGNASETEVDSSTQKEIRSTYRHGKKLPDHIRKQLEPRFGLAFGDILIHNDKKSHSLNRKLKSQAFTVGKDVYFGENKYKPETKEGKRLLAHELTHTVQQTGAESIQRDPLDETTTATPDNTDVVEGTLEEPTLNSEFTTTEQDETSTALDNDLSEDANSDLLPEPQFIEKGGGTHKVVEGDSLRKIAKNTYGNGNYWTRIRDANPNKVKRGGDLIFVGEELILPTIQIPKEPHVPTLGEINKDPLISEELTPAKQDVLKIDGKSSSITPWIDVEIDFLKKFPEIPIFMNPYFLVTGKPIIEGKIAYPDAMNFGGVNNAGDYKIAVEKKVEEILNSKIELGIQLSDLLSGKIKPKVTIGGKINLGNDWEFSPNVETSPPRLIFSGTKKGILNLGELSGGKINLLIEGTFGAKVTVTPNFPKIQKKAEEIFNNLKAQAAAISEGLKTGAKDYITDPSMALSNFLIQSNKDFGAFVTETLASFSEFIGENKEVIRFVLVILIFVLGGLVLAEGASLLVASEAIRRLVLSIF